MDVAHVLDGYKDRHKPFERVAEQMGVEYSRLMRQLNPSDSYQFPLSLLAPLILATNDFTILDHIEHAVGRVAIPIAPSADGTLNMAGLCRFVREAGEAMQAVSETIETGKIKKRNAEVCLKELLELAQISMALAQQCREIVEG